ncbi:MAG: hypothetical protein JXR97_00245 [Planctomycetes bacterium]|nr:hypothetical protein [Planctomycetota bacterium]
MKSLFKRSRLIIALLAIGGVIGTDYLLWDASGISMRIGSFGSLVDPIDSAVKDYAGNYLKKEQINARLELADDPNEVAKLSMDKYKVLGELGASNEQDEALLDAINRFPESRDKDIISIHRKMEDMANKKKQPKKFEEALNRHRRAALADPVDWKMLSDVFNRAEKAKLNTFIADTREMVINLDSVSSDNKLRKAYELYEQCKTQGLDDRIPRVEAIKKKCIEELGFEKAALSVKRTLDGAIGRAKSEDALIKVQRAEEFLGQKHYVLEYSYITVAHKAAKEMNWDVADKSWQHLAFDGPALIPDSSREKRVNTAFFYLAAGYMQGSANERMFALWDKARGLAPLSDMRRMISAERWAEGKREEASPIPLATAYYMPDAEIAIDGNLDEDVYKTLPPLTDKSWLGYNTEMPVNLLDAGALSISAYFFYTDTHLFFAARIPEKFPKEITCTLNRESKASDIIRNSYKSDSLNLMISLNRDLGPYGDWTILPSGAFIYIPRSAPQYEGRYCRHGGDTKIEVPKYLKDKKELISAEGGAIINEGDYTVEIKIPLWQLGLEEGQSPKGMLATANFRRNRYLSDNMAKELGKIDFGQKIKWVKKRRTTISWAPVGNTHGNNLWNFLYFAPDAYKPAPAQEPAEDATHAEEKKPNGEAEEGDRN